jgi:hypothetical protein
MNLQFDSLVELKDFLHFVGYGKDKAVFAIMGTDESSASVIANTEGAALQERINGAAVAAVIADESFVAGTTVAETEAKPARRRRSKAEVEADKAANATPAEGSWPVAGQDAASKGADSPFATTTEDVAETDATPEPVADEPAPKTDHLVGNDAIDAKMYMAERIGALGVISPVAHLTICRQFIAAHSMGPYIRTMQLVDGPGEVPNFNDDHRAQHVAAMEYVNKSLGGKALEIPVA